MSNDYDVKAINEECSGSTTLSNTNTKNSGNSDVSNSLNDTSYQNDSNNQYDTVNSESVKPLYGGKKNNKYRIEYEDKIVNIYGSDEKKVLKKYFKNIKIKKDIIVNIYNKFNKKNKYIFRNNKSNNLSMINY